MNPLAFILGIIAVLVLVAAISWLIPYIRRKRQNSTFPVTINYVRRDNSHQGPFLYLELELKNISGKSVFLSEVQQRHIKGPLETFLLQDAQGKTIRSLFEIREAFPKKPEIKNGFSLYRYYRMNLQPSIMNTKLYLQYRVITTAGHAIHSNAIWVVPSELEHMPFQPRE